VSKIKKEIKKEIKEDKKDWIKNELDIILSSLNKKLERKVYKDVEMELEESFQTNGIGDYLYDSGKSVNFEKDNNVDNINKEISKEIQLQALVKDCLGLLKCMKVEGDIDMDKNGFYLRTLKRISEIFPETDANSKMHKFSNSLIQIIEKFKNSSK
jgi:hypothetical protein